MTITANTTRHQIAAWLASQRVQIETLRLALSDGCLPLREVARAQREYERLAARLEALPDEPTLQDINAATGQGWIHPYTCSCCAQPAADTARFDLNEATAGAPYVYLCTACLQEGLRRVASTPDPKQLGLF